MELELEREYLKLIVLELRSSFEAEVFSKKIQNENNNTEMELKKIKELNNILNQLDNIKELKVLVK